MCGSRPLRELSEQGHDLASAAGLTVFGRGNHGAGAVQTGCLRRGFESHNVATALSFIMPWITVTSQPTDAPGHVTDRIGFQGCRFGIFLDLYGVEKIVCHRVNEIILKK